MDYINKEFKHSTFGVGVVVKCCCGVCCAVVATNGCKCSDDCYK